jgi:hypothetical protein
MVSSTSKLHSNCGCDMKSDNVSNLNRSVSTVHVVVKYGAYE